MSAISPSLLVDLSVRLDDAGLVDLTVDHGGRWLALVEDAPGTWRDPSGCFARTTSETGHPPRILGPDLEATLPDQRINPHFVRPLDADHWLLVCAR